MKKVSAYGLFLTGLILLLLNITSKAQPQTFDLATYTAPAGFTKQGNEQMVQYLKENDGKGGYCIINLYKSTAATGDAKTNFDQAWQSLVKETFHVADTPVMLEPSAEKGWETQNGYASFENDGIKGVAMLLTVTGYSKSVSILILTNTNTYEATITTFLSSVDLKKPGVTTVTENNPATPEQTATSGFTYSTTHFDDGWTSSIHEEWVQVTKGDVKVYLIYPLKIDNQAVSASGLPHREYYWENVVKKHFTIQRREEKTGRQPEYIEGWAIDKQTGANVFIGMLNSSASGIVYITIGIAKDEAAFRQHFPNAENEFGKSELGNLRGANRFAVGKNDLNGQWGTKAGGASVNWYSATTGDHVGTTAAVTGAEFTFTSNGAYNSKHSGGYGAVGAMNTFQQKYKGTYTVTDWTVTVTNRWEGKTQTMPAWFEAVKGGRILHLKEGPVEYLLFKEK